jgi:rare lipoprotein A
LEILELLRVKRMFCFFLSLCLLTFILTGCATAPRYTQQPPKVNKTKNSSYEQQQVTDPIKNPAVSDQSQIVTSEKDPIHNEISSGALHQNEPVFTQTGFATFYADNLQGKRTAYGERYNKFEYTAAHLTLPLNTMVRVTSLDNDKSVMVRINDRGPHGNNRIIDLSKAAAKEIDLIRKGVTKVIIEVFDSSSVTN